MELDPKDVQQSYNAAQATYQAALSNYEVVKENYKRYTALYEKGAVSTMIRDEHKTRYDAAASQLESARAQLTASGNQMDYTRLVSDHDGVVASISGEVGQVVGAGTPVATVVQDGNPNLRAGKPVRADPPEPAGYDNFLGPEQSDRYRTYCRNRSHGRQRDPYL